MELRTINANDAKYAMARKKHNNTMGKEKDHRGGSRGSKKSNEDSSFPEIIEIKRANSNLAGNPSQVPSKAWWKSTKLWFVVGACAAIIAVAVSIGENIVNGNQSSDANLTNTSVNSTLGPSEAPSEEPSEEPSEAPTSSSSSTLLTNNPSSVPSYIYSTVPSAMPSATLTNTDSNSDKKSKAPSKFPTIVPSKSPSESPTVTPSLAPFVDSRVPSVKPSITLVQRPLYFSNKWNIISGTCPCSDDFALNLVEIIDELLMKAHGIKFVAETVQCTCTIATNPRSGRSLLINADDEVDMLVGGKQIVSFENKKDLISSDEFIAIFSQKMGNIEDSINKSLFSRNISLGNGSIKLEEFPTISPSSTLSRFPTESPSIIPSLMPSAKPSLRLSQNPSLNPSSGPSIYPTLTFSNKPSSDPSAVPTKTGSSPPSLRSSIAPSSLPTSLPSNLLVLDLAQYLRFPEQSSVLTGNHNLQMGANIAVDGDTRPEVMLGKDENLSSTKKELSPWWKVELKDISMIKRIIIYNREDYDNVDYSSRLQGFRIDIYRNGNLVYTYDDTTSVGGDPGSVVSIDMNLPSGVEGNEVKISLPGKTEYLNLREVEIFGDLTSDAPSFVPSIEPTLSPSLKPSDHPTGVPTSYPSDSSSPSAQPTSLPSYAPSLLPSLNPSAHPTHVPSIIPSLPPSTLPSLSPSVLPTSSPSFFPSLEPSTHPTERPTNGPSLSPSRAPSSKPSFTPSLKPSRYPTSLPSTKPSAVPSLLPISHPSTLPTIRPSQNPSIRLSAKPSLSISSNPSTVPTFRPTSLPSAHPTSLPTLPTLINAIKISPNTAVQSSVLTGNHNLQMGANIAVDGDTRPEVMLGKDENLSSTKKELSPWWKVELKDISMIKRIIIYNREDYDNVDYSSRLQGFRIDIYRNGNLVYTYDDTTSVGGDPGSVVSIDMNLPSGVEGNEVKISLPGKTEYLNLREVQIWVPNTTLP